MKLGDKSLLDAFRLDGQIRPTLLRMGLSVRDLAPVFPDTF